MSGVDWIGLSLASTNKMAAESDPLSELVAWYEEAKDKGSGVADPCVMSLATASLDARPSLRSVRVQHLDRDGVVFYTNSFSQKSEQASKNPRVAGLFHWSALTRQVRLEGVLQQLPRAEVESHFNKIKVDAIKYCIIAFKSNVTYDSRTAMEQEVKAVAEQYKTDSPSCPDHFIGFRLVPDMVELYQSDYSGMYVHDRLRYTKQSDGGWKVDRLVP